MHTLEQLRAGRLRGVTRLQLACGLTEFPREIFELADSLEVLDLSGNQLSALPEDLPRLAKLRIVFCSNNRFRELPEVLGRCEQLSMVGFRANQIEQVSARALPTRLRWLVLTDNRLTSLPEALGDCSALQKLMLAGNRLTRLPENLAQCHNLELLRIAANQLTALPPWLTQLPRLAWLAYAGNPFSSALEEQAINDQHMPCIPWQELEPQEQLGAGASGVIYRAQWRSPDRGPRTVAVKLFKGAVTSDGLPHCEMAACVHSGQHPQLIPVLGKIVAHPQQGEGIVMELIGADFANLAGPPSLESCTRDVYAPDCQFSADTALSIAQGIASAVAHLHQQGILHGDLYGHNILHCPQGRNVIGDFGAASVFDPSQPQAPALQRLEVRAFGCLLEELLAHSPELCQHHALHTLAQDCLNPRTHERPLFTEITQRLAQA